MSVQWISINYLFKDQNNSKNCKFHSFINYYFTDSAYFPANKPQLSKQFPNVSSESDLQKYKTAQQSHDRKSPSLSNPNTDSSRQKVRHQVRYQVLPFYKHLCVWSWCVIDGKTTNLSHPLATFVWSHMLRHLHHHLWSKILKNINNYSEWNCKLYQDKNVFAWFFTNITVQMPSSLIFFYTCVTE